MKAIAWMLFVLSVVSCGEKSGPHVSIGFNPPLSQLTDVTQVVFGMKNLPVGGLQLDQDGDGNPDFFARPNGCTLAFDLSCGLLINQQGTFDISELPLNYSYTIKACVRDAAGTVKYVGNTSFTNDGIVPSVLITLSVNSQTSTPASTLCGP